MRSNNILFILFLNFVLSVSLGYAENWVEVSTPKNTILVDKDSIKEQGGFKFYNIWYYSKPHKNLVISTIQSTPEAFAIIKTCNFAYRNDSNVCPQTYEPVNKSMLSPVKEKSKIYNANLYAHKNIIVSQPQKADAKTKFSKTPPRPDKIADQYMAEMQKRIKANWTPDNFGEFLSCVVLYSISADGKLLSSEIKKSSGNEKYDQAALETIKITAPFPPIPRHLGTKPIYIQFTFDYNIYFMERKLQKKK